MDRDGHWDRIEKTYQLLTESEGETFDTAQAAIKSDYGKNITDEFIEPKVLVGEPIKENDALIFIDFREDSMRQLSRAFVEGVVVKFISIAIGIRDFMPFIYFFPNLAQISLKTGRLDFIISDRKYTAP